MRISIILGHPDENSFNHAIAGAVRRTLFENRHDVISHDLYQEKFPPLVSAQEIFRDARLKPLIREHCAEISVADGIIIVHPNWWGQPPAILKGWVDRVLRPGVAYKFNDGDGGEGIPLGLLNAKTALIFTTSNTPWEREKAVFGDPLETLWKDCIFGLCGVKNCYRKNFAVVVTSTLEQRQGWLEEAKALTNKYFPEYFILEE